MNYYVKTRGEIGVLACTTGGYQGGSVNIVNEKMGNVVWVLSVTLNDNKDVYIATILFQ